MMDSKLRQPSPDDRLNCLLIQPRFAAFSFWNYVDAAQTIGAKTPSPPLGLITIAALLPQNWLFRLLDLNCEAFSDSAWAEADIICVGGMLPQQRGILEIIRRAKSDGKFVVVGGADPTSQPEIYQEADALILGEGESTIPLWLNAWRSGRPRGVFKETEKPDVTLSPIPRFDLLKFSDYVQIGVQYSRGCPFNCEFCDIIELFGRKPRTKTSNQVLAELARLKELGYGGAIDLVDDNFIGNKRAVKRDLLPALSRWNRENGRPFFFCTEASMNVADDEKLLSAMREADFRVIFMGIETPDPDLLLQTQKSQNTVRPIAARVQKLYSYGMVVTAGFIMGFDGEKPGMDRSMLALIEETNINMAMIGLLVALPNTQLTRRLLKEGRLLSFRGELVQSQEELRSSAKAEDSALEVVDQTLAGLNFVTTRDRLEIFKEYLAVVEAAYEPKRYFDRVLRVGLALQKRRPRLVRWFELKRQLLGLVRVSWALSQQSQTRRLYWRNVLRLILRGPFVFEQCMRLMGIYLHFQRQTAYLSSALTQQAPLQERISRRFGIGKTQAKNSA